MREAHPRIEAAGAAQVTVSGKSAAMAAALQATVPFPLLLDPDHVLRKQLGINKLSAGQVMGLASARNYAKALGGVRHMAIRPSEVALTPTIVILDAEQNVSWQRVGEALGDYPTIDEVIAHIPTN